MNYNGKCWKFGDNVDTDQIIPARYLNTTDTKELAAHCMEDADPQFIKKAKPGDIIVAGSNFGCGSSREHAPIAIKAAGISCVIAKTFARIFFRNAINIGLPIFESPEAVEGISEGDKVKIDLNKSKIINLTTGKQFPFEPFAKEMLEIIEAGGLMNFVTQKMRTG
ncbi:MAG TPA: 3-isopropylmalate dehydratase small subunit [Candidatus Brocadiia bacterium]|nr:3-isopropylmalate dehydratase small subunit [Planctomycetota bacterium]MDO8094654.1 3-isopropylmalate dehydratase small subunit [Candidatus Brocadiales bacterium]